MKTGRVTLCVSSLVGSLFMKSLYVQDVVVTIFELALKLWFLIFFLLNLKLFLSVLPFLAQKFKKAAKKNGLKTPFVEWSS